MTRSKRRGRDELPEAARLLAEMVLDTPGLSLDMYARAGEVYRITSRGVGQRGGSLTVEQKHALFDLVDAQLRRGKSQEDAARYAQEMAITAEDRRAFSRLTEDRLIGVYKEMCETGVARFIPPK